MRLYAADAELLDKLCEKLDSREGEVIRLALQQLAKKHRVTAG